MVRNCKHLLTGSGTFANNRSMANQGEFGRSPAASVVYLQRGRNYSMRAALLLWAERMAAQRLWEDVDHLVGMDDPGLDREAAIRWMMTEGYWLDRPVFS